MFSTIGYLICIPFAALLRTLYTITSSYGVSLILFTLVIKLILLPLQMKSKKSMLRMSRMSGQIQEIQTRYANDRVRMNEEVQKFYAEEGVNPAGGCIWSFLPMPILLALYYIIREPVVYFMNFGGKEAGYEVVEAARAAIAAGGFTLGDNAVYEQIEMVNIINNNSAQFADFLAGNPNWVDLNYTFLGIDLSLIPSGQFTTFMSDFSLPLLGLMLIPLISGALSFFLSKLSMSQNNSGNAAAAQQMKTMMLMMPLMSVYIGYILPAALGVYWIAQSGISIVQEFFMGKFYNKKLQAEEDARDEERKVERAKRMEAGRLRQEEANRQQGEKKKKAPQVQLNKSSKAKDASTTEDGRVGNRPYARGRSYQEDRYNEMK